MLASRDPDSVQRVVVVRGGRGIEAYAAFHLEGMGEDEWGYRISCTHLLGTSRSGLASLLGYFRRFEGQGRQLEWRGPPTEPLALLMQHQSGDVAWTFRFMSRLLDVPGAFEARGYPPVDGEALLSVQDDEFPENRGPFLIQSEGGKVRAIGTDAPAERPIPVGALSSLFAGYLQPADLARLELMDEEDPALPLLTRLFAGPAPWMPDFF